MPHASERHNDHSRSLLNSIFIVMSITYLSAISFVEKASAAPLLYDSTVDSCTAVNCGAVLINGISMKNSFLDSVPFTAEVYVGAGQCVRLDVTTQTADMQTVLVSPSGAIWRNDNRGEFDFRPLITARGMLKGITLYKSIISTATRL